MLGQLALSVETPRGWMLKQVELDGRDITDRFFDLRGPSPNVRVRLTHRGAFSVAGLPPPDYLAVAVGGIDAGDNDPDFLEALREHATKVSIDYGESRTLALELLSR